MKDMKDMKAFPVNPLREPYREVTGTAFISFISFIGQPKAGQIPPQAPAPARRTPIERGDLRAAPSCPSGLFCVFIDQSGYPVEILRDSRRRRNRGPHLSARLPREPLAEGHPV